MFHLAKTWKGSLRVQGLRSPLILIILISYFKTSETEDLHSWNKSYLGSMMVELKQQTT